MISKPAKKERVAIIGMGLTLPGGATDPDSFWHLLEEKKDATIDIPKDRWDIRKFYSPYGSDKPGKMYVKRGGFMQGEVGAFDPLYFGISPREAAVMDIQQRLLLEVSAKALQDACLTDDQYLHSNMGVFIGGFCMDAKVQAASIYNRNWGISQSVTGSTATLLSNRISYAFDLKGPSLTVDTACSSSLVATHLAVESILTGECDTALIGGVNVMTQPEHFMEMCKGRLLSKDGRCFTWDQRANGYCRGEGAVVLVLKKLSQALADNDHIYAVIEGTGVNQDGTTKGISLPNPEAQALLIENVIRKAGLTPADIDYVEAHGTGTQAGDKAETTALNAVFMKDRKNKLVIGSVKTNIGHLEAAAGVSGLVKAVLSLQNRKIPANLHFETPNPDIPFDRMCLDVPTEMREWPHAGDVRYAGVNSFGYGGTNAHIILSAAPVAYAAEAKAEPAGESTSPLVLPLSAQSKESLKALAGQYAQLLRDESLPVPRFLRRVSVKRNHYDRRAFIQAADRSELIARLDNFSRDMPCEGIAQIDAPAGKERLVFVYSGMGPQWWGMGQELLAREPLFRKKIEAYDEVFRSISGWSILKELQSPQEHSKMAKTVVAQPANFVIQAALTELWLSWGITPAAVVGHSVGEVTSAYVSGILSLEDALLVSFHRSRLQGTLAGQGGMLAVGLSEGDVQTFLRGLEGQVSIAAVNAPSAVTLAGHEAPLKALAEVFEKQGVFHRALQVEMAYHSPVMDPIEAELKQCLARIRPQQAKTPCYSTVSGRIAQGHDFGAAYWWDNVRQPVLFAKSIEALCDEGLQSFLEVGPHPALTGSVKEVVSKKRVTGQFYTSLNRKTPELATLLQSLGLLYSQGYDLNWRRLHDVKDERVTLPAYPWQKALYDNSSPKYLQDKFGEPGHPILNRNLQLPAPSWEVELIDAMFPYMKDHQIGGKTVVPGAFYVEAGLALHQKLTGQATGSLKNLSFARILSLADEMDAEEKRIISTVLADQKAFRIYSTTTAPQESWVSHAQGEFAVLPPFGTGLDIQDHALEDFQSQDIASFYKTISGTGLHYGPQFRPIKALKSLGDRVYAEIEDTLSGDEGYILPPTILDSVFQTLFVFGGKYRVPFVPIKIERLSVHGKVTSRCKVLGRLAWMSAKSLKADFMIFDHHDDPVVEVAGVTCQALSQMNATETAASADAYALGWKPFDPESAKAESMGGKTVAVLAFDSSDAAQLIAGTGLAEAGRVLQFDLQRWSRQAFVQALQGEKVERFIYLAGTGSSIEGAFEHAVQLSARLADVVQGIQEALQEQRTQLLVCTRQLHCVVDGDRADGLSLSPLWGLGRTVNTEHHHIACACVDLSSADAQELSVLRNAVLCRDTGPGEWAIRGGDAFQHVMSPLSSDTDDKATKESAPGQRLVCDLASYAASSSVAFKLSEGAALQEIGHDEVEVEIDHMVLSRWDQASSRLKVYTEDPERHFFGYQAGMQGMGTVSRLGSGVTGLAVGERVLSVFPMGVSNFAVLPAQHVLKVPAQANPAPLADLYELVRVAYALRTAGPLRKGSTLLVKGVWGTFTQALLEYGRQADLRLVFVDERSGSVHEPRAAGLEGVHCLARQDGAWVDRLSGVAKHVDIFINDGAQDIDSVAMMNPFGKVIDFKFDQLERQGLGLPPPPNGSYHLVDIDSLYRDHPAMIKELLACALDDAGSGKLVLDTLEEIPLRDIHLALEMIDSGSAASVALRMKNETAPLRVEDRGSLNFGEGTYVITGGTRGFGLQCARWLAGQGARHLVLMSRSGLADEKSRDAVKAMQASGAAVEVCALDIGDAAALAREMARLGEFMPPVKGVIHGAMVLDDDFLSRMNEERFRHVMGPKVQGAVNLYKALEGQSLDFFLMFSSISSLIGNAGQANYVAANSFLDSFAAYLSSRQVPAKTINWGVLSDTGVLANDAALVKVLELSGIRGVNNEMAMAGMERVLSEARPQTGIFHVDWHQWAQTNPTLSQSGFYRELLDQAPGEGQSKLMEVLEVILPLNTGERMAYIQGELAAKFGEIFRMPPEAINIHSSIIELGVDSLIAAEISVALKGQIGIDVPMIELLSGPSLSMLATKLLAQIEVLIEEGLSDGDGDDGDVASEPSGSDNTQLAPAS